MNIAKAYHMPLAGGSIILPDGARITFVPAKHRTGGIYVTADPEEQRYLDFLAARPSAQVRIDDHTQAELDAHAKAPAVLQGADAAANIAENVRLVNSEVHTDTQVDTASQHAGALAAASQLGVVGDLKKVEGAVPTVPSGLADLAALAAKIHAAPSGIANTTNQVVPK